MRKRETKETWQEIYNWIELYKWEREKLDII